MRPVREVGTGAALLAAALLLVGCSPPHSGSSDPHTVAILGDSLSSCVVSEGGGPESCWVARLQADPDIAVEFVNFAVPGAFTPTCSMKHVPGFVNHADEIKAKGVDIIACMSVNDAFVMDAWGKDRRVGDKVVMLADGSAELSTALGLDLDLKDRGLGVRAKRFAMVVEDGVVTTLNVEEAGVFDVSSAESVLAAL